MSLEWGSAPDWASAAANFIVAGAAAFAAYQGWRGLSAWRSETLGRRQMELAEEALAGFYEARDVYRWVRSPFSHSGEGSDREGRDSEAEFIRLHRDTFYVPLKRLADNKEFFGKLQARRYRVVASFGPAAEQPYIELGAVHSEIAAAAQALMRIIPSALPETTDLRLLRERLERTIWHTADDDEIGLRVASSVAHAEELFRPVLTQSLTKKPEQRKS